MTHIQVISKEAHKILNQVDGDNISLSRPSVVILKVDRNNVKKIEKIGHDALITLDSGEKIIINQFFNDGTYHSENSLVFDDGESKLIWVQFTDENGALLENITYNYIDSIDPLLYQDDGTASPLAWAFIPTAAAGILWWANDSDNDYVAVAPPTKPATPEGFIDNEGDKTGTFPGGTETDDTTPGIIIGPIEAGEIPKLIVDGQEVESTYDPDTGTLTPVDPLPEGQHEIGFTVTDPKGNESEVSDPIIVIVDTTPPAKPTAPESFVDNEGKQTGTFPGGTETDDTTPGIIIGPIEAGEIPKLIVDGQEVESTYDPDTGTLTPVDPLPEGQHEIGFTVTDPAGNESEVSDPIIVIVDTTPPAKPTAPEGFIDNEGDKTGTFPGGTETDDTTPGIIIGPIEAGEIPKLIVDGQEVESVYDPDTGTLTPVDPLAEGEHEIGFTVTDPAGNESDVSDPIIVIVDTIPPAKPTAPESFIDNEGKQTGTFPGGTETDDTTPGMIIGPIEAGETPKLIVDGQEVESTYDPDTGTLTPVNPLPEGQHEIGFTVTDPAGNESEVSDPIIVIVDTTSPAKPTAPESFVDNEGKQTGTFPGGTETDDTTPGMIIGPIEAGEIPKLIVDGQEVESTYDPDTGTLTPANPLPEGQHEIGFTVTDPAGNESEVSDPIIVIVDTTPPAKPTAPESFVDNEGKQTGTFPGGTETDDTTPGMIIGPIEVGETPKLIVDGQEVESVYDPDTGTLTPVDPLAEGEHEIGFTVTDPAGNESEVSDPIIVIVDTTPPVKPTAPESFVDNEGDKTGTFPGGSETDDTTPGIIIGPIEAGETPKLIVDGQEVESVYDPDTGTLTPVNPLPEGQHEIGFTITDPAGNESEVSDPIIVIVDTTPPVKPTSPESFVDNNGKQTGTFPGGSETDDTTPGIIIGPIEAGETPKLIVDGQEVESTYDPDTGTLTPVDPLAEGEHEIGFTVTDPAGNESEVSDPIIVIVDTTAPNVLRIDSVIDDVEFITGELSPGDYTNDRHPTVNGSGAEAHALIILKDTNGQILGTTTADTTGHWRVEPDTGNALTDGLHNLQVTQTDQAGNESPAVSFELNVDATAPTQSTTITGIEDDQSPVTGNVAHQGYTDDRTPTLKGSISAALGANEKVVILRDGVVIGEATVTGTDWNYTDSGLLDGTQYQYTARVEDSAGNRGGDSNGYIINIDSSVPTQSITIQSVTDNFGPVQGDLNSGATTDDSTPTLNGIISSALAANEVIVIYRDGVKVGQANISAGATNWSYTDGGLSNGNQYSYTARVEDASGLQGPVSNDFILQFETSGSLNNATITAIEDDQLPVLGTVQNNGYTNDISPLLLGRLDSSLAAGEKVAVYRDGVKIGEAIVNGMDWQYQDDGLAHGHRYSYTVAVESAAGNPGAESTSYVIHIDNEAPSQTIQITAIIDNKDPVTGVIANGGVTNDDTPEIKGSLSAILGAGETVVVYRNGIEVGTATVTGTNWSFTDASLGSGESYSYSAEVRDLAGNVSDLSNLYSITTNFDGASQTTQILRIVDNVDPVTGVVPNNGASNDTTPTLEGSIGSALNAGDVVVIKRDGVEIGTATVTGTSWSFTDQLLADGSYTYTAVVRNNVGVEGAASGDYTITLDTQAPTASSSIISYTDNVAPQEGEFASGSVTNDTSPSLNIIVTGSLAIGEVVAVYRDGVKIGYADLIGGDQYQFTDSALKDGRSYDYTTRVEDAAGNLGAQSDVFTVIIDTTAPNVLRIDSVIDDVEFITGELSPGDYTNDRHPTVNGSGAEAHALIILKDTNGQILGTTTADATGHWRVEPDTGNALTDGLHNLQVTQTDQAGNESPAVSFELNVDATAPTQSTTITGIEDDQAPVTGNVAHQGYTDDRTPTLKGSISAALAANEKVVILRDGVVIGEATVTGSDWNYTDSGLLDGTQYQYTARVEDSAGNRGGDSNGYIINIDSSVPTQSITIQSVTDNFGPVQGDLNSGATTDDSTPTLNGIISSALAANEVIVIYRDGVKVGQANISAGATNWSYTDGGLSNGNQYSYTARVEDASGLQGPVSNDFILQFETSGSLNNATITAIEDDQLPVLGTVQNNGYTNDISPLLLGRLDSSLAAGEKVAVYRDGVKIGEAIVNGMDWQYQDDGLAHGHRYSYTVAVESAAGNPGAESTSYVIHIDNEAPSQTIQITAIIDNKDPVTGVIANGGVTNDDTPEIKGSLSAILGAGETVVVYRNGIEVGTATVTGTNWSFTDASLGSGESYSYSAEVRDLAGNVSDLSNLYSITTNFDGASQTTQILRIVDNVDPVTGVVPNNGASNDTTPTLEGSIGSALNAGDVVVIKRDGVEIGTATVTGTSWSFTDQLLADGSYTYTAVVRNNVGVEGAASGDYTITLDTQAPTASSSIISYTDNVAPQEGEFASGSVTNDTSPSLNIIVTGSLAIGEVVAVYRDGVKIGYADLIGGDQYQFTDSALKDGRSYDYTTRVEDAAGNLGAQSDVFTIIIDTTAPNVLRIDSVIDDVEFITGELSPGDYTNDRHPTVNGSGAEAHALIILKDTNGQILGTTTADATGHWRVEPDTGNALTDGLHNLQVTQTDQAGNESPAVSFELNVDATAPTQSTTITGIKDDQSPVTGHVAHQGYTDDRTPTLKGSISAALGANEKVVILRDGVVIGEATVTGTDWNYTDSGLLDGTQYQYTARVEDSAGNRGGDSNGYIINIDSSVPTQSITIQSVTDNFGPVQGDLNSGATTDDSTPTLNGIISSALAANEVIVIYRDGVKVGQANISAGATNWSYTDGGLSNGNQYSYTARVEDASGLQGPVSNDFILQFETSGSLNNATITAIEDDQLPVLGTVQNNGYTNDISPLLLGRLDSSLAAGEKVAVYRDGVKIGEAIVNGMDWQYQDDGLAHGHRYSYTVAVESAAGNPGAESTSYVIHIDNEAPSQTIQITAIIDNKDPVTGVIANGGVTNDDTPEIKGSLSAILGAGETVVVYRNGIEVGTATVTGTNWSFTDASLGSGESYSYSAEVRDLAGNVSDLSNLYSITTNFDGASQTTQILRIVDNVDPVTGVVPNNGASNDTTPTLEGSIGSALNAGDVVVIKRDGVEIGTATVTGTSWSFTDQLLADGSYTYTAVVRNNVGVEGAASGDYTITLDTQAPTASSSIISYTDNVAPQEGEFASGSVTNDTSPSLNIIVTGSLAIGEVVVVYRDGVKIGYADLIGGDQYQFTDSALKDGRSYDYTTRVEDAAGNLGAQSDVFTLTVDLTAPSSNLVIEITSITDDTGYSDSDFITNDTSLTINGTLTGTLATDEFAQISIDAGLTWTTVDVIAGVWSYVDGRTLTDGTYTYHVRVVDAAGNVGSTSSQDVIIDITAPTQTAVITDYSDDVGQFQGNFLSGTKTDDLTPTLNGTLDLGLGYGEQLAIYQENNGTVTFLGYATVTGTTWRYDVNSNLQDGETYNFYAHVVDIAGNVGSQSNSLALTVDTTPPDVTNLVTTAEIDVDTANGVPLSGSTNTITATNKDLITRDASPELLSGSLSRELAVGEMLQISLDGGVTWRNVTTLTGQKYWEHTLNTVYQNDTTITVQLRVSDEAGNTAQLINQEKIITIDLTSPEGLDLAPIVDQLTDISKSYTFNSAVYGALEAGTTIALINDVNNNSMWQEGMDKVIATAVVASDGSWSITTTLPAGALNLGFILWDAAGNVSSMSNITSVGVASSVTGSEIIEATWGGTTDAEGYGLNAASVTISANGTWSFFQSVRGTTGSDTANAGRVYTQNGSLTDYTSAYLAQPSTSNGGDYNLTDWGYGRFVNSAMFADINRDGYVDVVSQISSYSNSGRTAYWLQNADGTWTPQVLDQGTLNHLGGAIAYDRTGDGYLDFVLADSEADSISFIKNNGGVLSYESNGSNGMPPSGAFTISNGLGTGSVTGNKMPIDLSVIHETGAVDLDNNGTVDVVAHVDYNGTLNYGNLGRGLGILYNSGTEAGFTYVNHANVFADDGHLDYGNLSQSVTFADFNGDGWLDMYLNRGAKNGVNSDESRIYLNNGKGQLNASDADAIWFGDNLKGGTSFAVDWNFDGLMDVIEVPAQIGGYITAAFAPTLYLNSGNGNWGQNPVALTPTIYGDVTGAVVVDYDWDGSLDLVLYHAGSDAGVVATDNSSPTTVIYNANVAADGTSLQIRILDGEGINTYYSNTVKLYDSKGNMVATQLINPQSSGSSNSMGLVSFYGLNANETYSVQLLRITNGVSDNVGGVANLGGYTNSTINTTWSGLTTGKAHDAYVLTAESSTAVNDSAKNSVGIVGTGYNDHFFGTLGNDHFNGGGGWIINSVGDKEWQANGGLDILDYSLLDAQISVDVSSGKVSKIVNGVVYQDTFENIEKFIAGSGDTVFTGGTSNDHFVGGQGNDTYNLGGVGGGSDTIYFALLNANNATGGNGSDVVNGFHVGSIATDIEADIIDLHEILDGYKGTPSLYTDSDGVKLDISSSDLLNFIDVSSDGTNTTISVDRDGTGQNFTTLITLNNVDTDLITLLMNNQLVI